MDDLPDELLYDIMGRLDIDDLMVLLRTNANLRSRMLPYFQGKIDAEYEPESSRIALMRRLDQYQQQYQSGEGLFDKLYVLNRRLARVMGLTGLFDVGTGFLVNYSLLFYWWTLYVLDRALISYNGNYYVLHPDDLLADFLSIREGRYPNYMRTY